MPALVQARASIEPGTDKVPFDEQGTLDDGVPTFLGPLRAAEAANS